MPRIFCMSGQWKHEIMYMENIRKIPGKNIFLGVRGAPKNCICPIENKKQSVTKLDNVIQSNND